MTFQSDAIFFSSKSGPFDILRERVGCNNL